MAKTLAEKVIEKGTIEDDEQYQQLVQSLGQNRFSTENGDEVFWGVCLNDKYFMFCNNILRFLGHSIVGRVGKHSNYKMLDKATVDFFIEIDKKGK